MTPALVACAHGTRDPAGRRTVAQLWLAAAAQRPQLSVAPAYVDVQPPEPLRALRALRDRGRCGVVVPLLLSGGYHVHVDIARAVGEVPGSRAAAALGPDAALVDVLADRLHDAGCSPGDAVVVAAAGSSDPRAVRDVQVVVDGLAARRDAPTVAAYLSAVEPRVPEAVTALVRRGHRVAVATYLLAPGVFARQAAERATAAGAAVVSPPLGADPRIAALLLRRYDEALEPGRTRRRS